MSKDDALSRAARAVAMRNQISELQAEEDGPWGPDGWKWQRLLSMQMKAPADDAPEHVKAGFEKHLHWMQTHARCGGISPQGGRKTKLEVWQNRFYFVNLWRDETVLCASSLNAGFATGENASFPKMVWLSIRARDRSELRRDWREFQRIKNELVGADCEGVELYPAEKRLVDTADQFHLWVFEEPDVRFPFGYLEREVNTPEQAKAVGAYQRPRDPEPAKADTDLDVPDEPYGTEDGDAD